MHFKLKDHFIVINGNPKTGPTYVAPHAAISFHKPYDNQDEGTHHIAYRLVQDGGRAIVSSVTRERDIGIDFFREPPSKELALKKYKLFKQNRRKETRLFRKRYAWVARNVQEHRRKQRIFRSFWSEIAKSRGPVLFLHRQYLNPIRHPSLIDIIPFNGEAQARKAVEAMNKRHAKLFNELFPLYKEAFWFKTRGILFKRKFGKRVNMKVFEGLEPKIERRVARFRKKTDAMPYIKITYMENFNGKTARGLVKEYLPGLNMPIIQLEFSEFLTRDHTEIAVYLTKDLLGRINGI